MSRLLPAHLLALGGVLGLAGADVMRVHPPPPAALLALALALALLVVRPRARVIAAAALLGAAGWWWGSARLDSLDHSVLRADVDRAGRALVEVTGEPRRGMFLQRQSARVRRFESSRVDERVQLELPLGRAPPQGALVSLLAVVRLPRGPANGFDERTWLRRQGVHVVLRVDEWHVVGRRGGLGGAGDRVRSWLRAASAPGLTGERRAVLEGVVLGDDNGLSPSLKQAFRRSGLYHLLAVSGQNVVLLAAGVLALVSLLGVARAWGHVGALAAIGAYVLAVGPQPSVIRAAVAGCAVSVAWLVARERDQWHVLLLAAIALLAWSPYALFDPGFQLSFAAVIAIFLAARPLARELEGYPLPQSLRIAVPVATVCSIATAPILWLQFGAVPLLGVVANALVEPAVGPLLGLAFAAAAVDPVSPALASALAWLNGWLAAYVVLCARAVAAVPFAQARGDGAAVATAGALVTAAVLLRVLRSASR